MLAKRLSIIAGAVMICLLAASQISAQPRIAIRAVKNMVSGGGQAATSAVQAKAAKPARKSYAKRSKASYSRAKASSKHAKAGKKSKAISFKSKSKRQTYGSIKRKSPKLSVKKRPVSRKYVKQCAYACPVITVRGKPAPKRAVSSKGKSVARAKTAHKSAHAARKPAKLGLAKAKSAKKAH